MFTWLTKILQLTGKDNISWYGDMFFKRSFAVLSIQFTGLLLAFTSNIILARLYGEEVYGIYSLISSWLILLSVIAVFGMDDVHLVQIPGMKLRSEKQNIRHLLNWSLLVNTVSILLVMGAFYIIIHFSSISTFTENAHYFDYALLIICFLTLLSNFLSFLRGMDKVIWGEIADKILRPVFFLLLLLIFFYQVRPDMVVRAIAANGIALFCIVIILFFTIRKSVAEINHSTGLSTNKFHLSANFRYVFLNLLYFLSTRIDILILGLLSTVVVVGHYNVALRFADIFGYPVAIINLSMPTLLSTERHNQGEQAAAFLLRRVSKNSFFQSLLLGIFFLIAGYWILQWYGKGFSTAFPVLIIFLVSNLISASMGSADVFFIMHKQEKKVIYARIFSLVIMILLAIKLIPAFGIMGAAVSSLAGNAVYCILLQYSFYRKYGFLIHPFSAIQ